jgi:hypothetical protein
MSVNILIVSGKPLTTPKLQRIKRTGLFICSFQIRMTNERRLLDGGFTKNYLRKPAIIDEEIMRVSAFGEYAIYIANRIVEDVETIFIGKLKYDKFKKSLYLYLEDITRLPEPEEYIILDGRKIYRPKDPNPMPSSINESQKLDNLIDEIKMIEEVEEIDDGMPDEEPEEK